MKSKKKIIIIIAIVVIVLLIAIIGIAALVGGSKKGYPVETAKVTQEDISSEIEVSGTVVSEETKVYFAPVGGKLATCDVEDGKEVKAGDQLLTYDLEDIELATKESELRAKAERYGIDATVSSINKQQENYNEAVKNYDDAILFVNHWSSCLESASHDYNEAMAVMEEYTALKAELDAYKIKQADNEKPNEALAKLIEEDEAKLKKLEEKKSKYDYSALEGAVKTCSEELNEYKALAEQYKAQKVDDPSLASQSAQQSVLKEINNLEKENADKDLNKAKEGVVADFGGIVSEVSVVEGQTIAEGMQLFKLQSTDKLKVTVAITKYDLEQIAEGQKAEITINGNVYDGTVTSISRLAGVNANGASTVDVDVHINNPDGNIFLGLEGKVKIFCDTVEAAYVLPFSCVNYDTKGAFCYVVEDGVVVRREVETGLSSGMNIQIISGVSLDDVVISEVTAEITEGMAVSVTTDEPDTDSESK